MTVSTATTRAELNGNGTAGPFQCGFRVLADTDLSVYVDGSSTAKTLTTHYTVANAGTTSNATVTFTTDNYPVSGTANVVLVRNVPYTQLTDYQNNTELDAETMEASFDRNTMQSQQLSTDKDRTIRYADTVTSVTTAETEIADVAGDRADKLLAFNSTGQLSATQEIGAWQGNWVSGTVYNERDLVKDGETGAVYICTSVHTAGTFTTDSGNWSAVIDAGGFNVKLTANVTVDSGEKLITPYKLDLNGYELENNGTVICAELITGDGTVTGSNGVTESGPINLTDAGIATVTGNETLTNKSLTAPILTGSESSAGSILFKEDTDNGAHAVTLKGPASTADVTLTLPSATDTLVGKDTTDTLTQKTLTTPKIADAGYIADANGAEQLVFQTTSSAENHFEMTNAADSNSPQLAALGDDTNVGMILNTKGTGSYELKVGGTLALTIALSGGNTTITGP